MSYKEIQVSTTDAIALCQRALDNLVYDEVAVQAEMDARFKLIKEEANAEEAAQDERFELNGLSTFYKSFTIWSKMINCNEFALYFRPRKLREQVQNIVNACRLVEGTVVLTEEQIDAINEGITVDTNAEVQDFMQRSVWISTSQRDALTESKKNKANKPVLQPEEVPTVPSKAETDDAWAWIVGAGAVIFLIALIASF